MRALLVPLAAALLALAAAAQDGPSAAVPVPEPAGPAFEAGVEAYRRGDHASAETLWRGLLERDLPEGARAAVCFNLGNAAFRQERALEAVAWYTAAVRLSPRDADAWANLEFARAAAGLEPADRGDLTSTARRLLGSLTRAEAEWLSVGGALVLALLLAGEALRGGLAWRRLAWVGVLVAGAASLPLAWQAARAEEDPCMIVLAPAASLRSEPREDLPPIGQVEAAEVVERVDALPGWTRIEREGGVRGWVRSAAVQPLTFGERRGARNSQ